MSKRTSEDVIRQLQARGWAPALWAHHPPEVKAAIRAMGWRPQVKQCFANCQRFILGSHGLDVEYREGYVVTLIPMAHAWLVYKGEVLDLTLDPDREVQYLDSYAVSHGEILATVLETHAFGPVRPQELNRLSPFFKQFQALQDLQEKGLPDLNNSGSDS